MPRRNVTGTGSGFERRACDHSVCLLELWSSEISGPRTSPHYRKTLTRTAIKPKRFTYDERTAALHQETIPKAIGWIPEGTVTLGYIPNP